MSWPSLLQQKVAQTEVAIQWSEKDFQLSIWLRFQNTGQTFPVLTIFFESCNSMKMKTNFNCHFGFAFTLFSESHNLINPNEKDFQRYLGLFSSKSKPLPFWWSILKVTFQSKWKGLSAVILTLSSQHKPARLSWGGFARSWLAPANSPTVL